MNQIEHFLNIAQDTFDNLKYIDKKMESFRRKKGFHKMNFYYHVFDYLYDTYANTNNFYNDITKYGVNHPQFIVDYLYENTFYSQESYNELNKVLFNVLKDNIEYSIKLLNKLGNAIYQRHEGIFLKYENYIQEMFVKNKEEYFTKLKNSPMKLLNILQICYPYINRKDSEKIIPIILKVNISTSERKIKNLIKVWEKSKIDIAPLQAKLLLADIKND